ncbi:hypothetical protein KC360_g187 [Hortaea werneckii]|nr:hypothetical protein KC360_g187 [Hortaea werneckii]
MFFLSLHRLIDIVSFGQVIRFADSPAVGGLTVGRQALGEFTAVADLRAVPVEDVDGDDDDAGDGGQEGSRVVDGRVRGLAQVVVQGCGVHGRDTGEEVSSLRRISVRRRRSWARSNGPLKDPGLSMRIRRVRSAPMVRSRAATSDTMAKDSRKVKMRASEKPDRRDRQRTMGSVTSMRPRRSDWLVAMLGSSPVLRRRLASLSSMIVDRLSGMKKKMHMAPALKINWIQKFQRHSRKRSTGPPTTPPILVPIQEAKTMNASGHCCSSGWYRSAIKPRVTLPPAVERPA